MVSVFTVLVVISPLPYFIYTFPKEMYTTVSDNHKFSPAAVTHERVESLAVHLPGLQPTGIVVLAQS